MDNQPKKQDPIGELYFKPLETAEMWVQRLFYITAILSFAVLLVSKIEYPKVYGVITALFIVAVLVSFVIELTVSLYLKPRAEDKRLQDFLSKSYGVSLNNEETHCYYNNEEKKYNKRIGAQLLENCYFSKTIILKMLKIVRIKNSIYIFIWLFLALYRYDDLELVAIAAQVLFSEQIISHWIKLEWLRTRVEKIYETLYRHFQNTTENKKFEIIVQENFIMYECAKAKAGITLSSKIFNELNEKLSEDWIKIKGKIGIK